MFFILDYCLCMLVNILGMGEFEVFLVGVIIVNLYCDGVVWNCNILGYVVLVF